MSFFLFYIFFYSIIFFHVNLQFLVNEEGRALEYLSFLFCAVPTLWSCPHILAGPISLQLFLALAGTVETEDVYIRVHAPLSKVKDTRNFLGVLLSFLFGWLAGAAEGLLQYQMSNLSGFVDRKAKTTTESPALLLVTRNNNFQPSICFWFVRVICN